MLKCITLITADNDDNAWVHQNIRQNDTYNIHTYKIVS